MTLVRPTVATAAASPGGPETASQSGLPPNFRAKVSVQRPWMGAALAPSSSGCSSPSDRWAPVAVVGGAPQARAATGHRQQAGAGLASAKTDRTLRFRTATVGRRRIQPESPAAASPPRAGGGLAVLRTAYLGPAGGSHDLACSGAAAGAGPGRRLLVCLPGSLGGGPSGRARREGPVAPAMERGGRRNAIRSLRVARCRKRAVRPGKPLPRVRGRLPGRPACGGGGGATFGGRPSNTRFSQLPGPARADQVSREARPVGLSVPTPCPFAPQLKPCPAPSTAAPPF